MPYEKLVNPHVGPVEVAVLAVAVGQGTSRRSSKRSGKDYSGRRLYLLFNPSTGRTNGTHAQLLRHDVHAPGEHRRPAAPSQLAAAINYYFDGSGYCIVEGKRLDWKAGDLMLSAPGWAVHNHASDDGDRCTS